LFPVDEDDAESLLSGAGINSVFPVEDIYQKLPGRILLMLDTHGELVNVPDNVVLAFSGSLEHEALESYVLDDGTTSKTLLTLIAS
jgi:hypothetical protein